MNRESRVDVIKLLIEYGANLELLYTRTLESKSPISPGHAASKIFMIGHTRAGKSTLTKALHMESSGLVDFLAKTITKVSHVECQTAGIVPHVMNSKRFGLVTIFDFAGHEEFGASHDAVVQNTMMGSTGVFLVLASLQKTTEDFTHSITYWLSFVENIATTRKTKPHVLLVATHSDQVTAEEKAVKRRAIEALHTSPVFSKLDVSGYVEIDCRRPGSISMRKLRDTLAATLETLHCTVPTDPNYHIFYIYLLDRVNRTPAVQLKKVISTLTKETKELYCHLSKDPTELDALCQLLNAHGRILYLRCRESVAQSWIVMDQHALLAQVNGTIFAPNGFTEHQTLASCTGVVPSSKLHACFPDLEPTMLTQFLTHIEFCCRISDPEALELLLPQHESAAAKSFFFFPSLIQDDTPDRVWEPSDRYTYHSGWLLQCTQPEHFTARFHQTLLVRLSLQRDSAEGNSNTGARPAIYRQCKVWKNGIYWSQGSGVEVLVEITSKQVTVLVRSLSGCEMAAVELRSAIVRKVFDVLATFCASIAPTEHLVRPSDAKRYPLKPLGDLDLVNITAVARALARGDPCVISDGDSLVRVDELLHFEPYAHLRDNCLHDLFNDTSPDPLGLLFSRIAEPNHTRQEKFILLFELSPLQVEERLENLPLRTPTTKLIAIFEIWKGQGGATRQHLRLKFDKFSIFAGRSPLEYI